MCLSSSRQCVQVSSGHPGSSTAMVSATKWSFQKISVKGRHILVFMVYKNVDVIKH